MKRNLNHAVENFYIGKASVEADVTFSRQGAEINAYLDMGKNNEFVTMNPDEFFSEKRLVSWDEIENAETRFTHRDGIVVQVAQEMARGLVKKALHLKNAGVTYCDGSY